MVCLKETVKYNLCGNCGMRINAAITALIPAIDYAQTVLPTLRDHLPANVYSAGFVIIAVANIMLHIRFKPPKDPAL